MMTKEHYYAIMTETPIGDILLVGSEDGISNIDLNIKFKNSKNIPANLKKKYGFAPIESNRFFSDATKQLREYFSGKRLTFDLKLDLSGVTPFRKKVYNQLLKVKNGEITSYGKLAQKSGGTAYSRAVGSAMANNPIPIIIPCHRVIKSDGGLGGFGGGLPLKVLLLSLEGAKSN